MSASRETSSSFSHKVAYWTKKMGISSSNGGGGGAGQHHQHQNHHYQTRPDQQTPPYPSGADASGSGVGGSSSNAALGQPYNNHHHHHRPAVHKGPNPYRSSGGSNNGHGRPSAAGAPYHHHGRTATRAGAAAASAAAAATNNNNNTGYSPPTNSLADAMDESEDLLYQSTQGMQKMNVDSRDETDHHTTATASTAAATHSYSIDDGSTGRVSESGTEVVHMPPRTIGANGYGPHGGAAARQTTPYNAHSFKAGNQTFTVDTKYSLIRVIGSGAYGVVISSLDSSTQTKVAIKMVPRAFHDEVDAKRILREIKLLKHFRHENIVGITDMMPPLARNVEDFHDVYICNELMETDLHRIIYSKQPLTIDHAQYFLYQILRALKYIHSANVLHRDLKPSNLLVNSNCDLKVCDFGLARGVLSDEEMIGKPRNALLLTEYVVTRWYRAPEIMLACHEYAKPVDVWSVGCIFAELLGRKPYFPGDDYIDQLTLITEKLGKLPESDMDFITSEKAKRFMRKLPDKPVPSLRRQFPGTPNDALDLLGKMLQIHPRKRITVEQALQHPFLEQLHNPEDEPVCESTFDWAFEDENLNRVRLQELIWEEVGDFRPGCLPVPTRRDGTRGGPGKTRKQQPNRRLYHA